MKSFLIACLSVMLLVGVTQHAEAKRFGGGFSLGKSYSTQKKVAPAPTKQTTATKADSATAGGAATAAKPGMGGMLGGLVAGGLLGALLFGGAFEGIQLMDILLIGLAIFLLMRFLGAGRRPALAGGAGAMRDDQPAINARQSSEPLASSSTGFDDSADEALVEMPDWFDAEAFLAQAPEHFAELQQAWDLQDWDKISEYTSPELLAQLKTNREVLPEVQHTEVVSCMAEVVGFQQSRAETVVSIHFHGWIREQSEQEPSEFSEIWHLGRVAGETGANWVILGIEQPES